jgi:hypothetical protein
MLSQHDLGWVPEWAPGNKPLTAALPIPTNHSTGNADVSKPLGGAHIIVCDLSQETLKRVTLQAACPTPPPAKCKENLPPEPVRTVNLRRMGRVGDMAEIRVGWSLPPGDACVRQVRARLTSSWGLCASGKPGWSSEGLRQVGL